MFAKVLKLGFEQETQKRKTLKSWRAEKKNLLEKLVRDEKRNSKRMLFVFQNNWG